jgi:hypothetical protein
MTLRDFLVYPEAATRRLIRELEPLLQERAGTVNSTQEGIENNRAAEEESDGGGDGAEEESEASRILMSGEKPRAAKLKNRKASDS